jgi:hypothetical protein
VSAGENDGYDDEEDDDEDEEEDADERGVSCKRTVSWRVSEPDTETT